MKITRWTCNCGCIIEFEWDETVSEDQRVHSYYDSIKICQTHDGLAGSELLDTLLKPKEEKNE